ncbi:MAG: DUF6599 family protein [Gemmatimonadota bacterium]|nr:DUF6599 family protein [Gemmatimonadota bacterium]
MDFQRAIKKSPGFLLLLLSAWLLLSLCSCGKGRETEPEPEAGASSGQQQSARDPADHSAIAALLPGQGEASAWKKSGQERFFVPDNLWEYINGGAEGYLVFDFQEVATADYETENAGGLQAVVDIYRMGSDLCGFGIYASERSYEADYIDIGAQGYLAANALHLFQGPYYVKITAFKEGEGVGGELEQMARAICAKIGGGAASMPGQLDVFPKQGLVPHSERYLARDMLGQSDLKNGFTAEYKLEQAEFKLFFILHDDHQSSERSFESYMGFMKKYGKNLDEHTDEGNRWFSADDSYYGKVVTQQAGKAVLGILGAPDVEILNKYLQQMQQKLISMKLV